MSKTPVKSLFLSIEDVVNCELTLSRSIELVTQSLSEHGAKEVENPPKPGVHTLPDAFIHAMPAFLKQSRNVGLKWVSGYPTNQPKGLPTIFGLIIYNDAETGLPLSIMDGTYITALRTAAVSAVAAKHLARKESTVLSIIGTGVQGKYNLLTVTHTVPTIKEVRIYDSWEPSVKSFVAEASKRTPDLKVTVCSSIEEAIEGGDIVITATGKLLKPLFFEKSVKKGALVLPVHTGGWGKDTPPKMDKLFVDDWAQFHSFGKDIYDLPEAPNAELGEVVIGSKRGRESDDERIINFNVGLGIHDIIFASEIYKLAKEKGIGQEITLTDGSPIPIPPVQ